jgi:hypothetical protein
MKSTTSGEHLGNAIVSSSLWKVFLLRRLPELALALATAQPQLEELENNE